MGDVGSLAIGGRARNGGDFNETGISAAVRRVAWFILEALFRLMLQVGYFKFTQAQYRRRPSEFSGKRRFIIISSGRAGKSRKSFSVHNRGYFVCVIEFIDFEIR
jgi:UDP-N-acetylmuramyl pentapeptide phosphotransferase/UDP-N-acetylglucosamine-1-phosphate transferase